MKKYIHTIFKIAGSISVVFAVLFAMLAIPALMDRINNGPGIMFADVEFLSLLTVFFLIIGIILLFAAKRIKKDR
jgi:hypothetical protein